MAPLAAEKTASPVASGRERVCERAGLIRRDAAGYRSPGCFPRSGFIFIRKLGVLRQAVPQIAQGPWSSS